MGTRYKPEIDGLRALAVLSVILHHFDSNLLPSGYLGVDIFFVISGFVITASLAARPASKGLGDLLLSFYARRVRRILPTLVVCVMITSLLACLFDPLAGVSLRTGVTSLLGYANLHLRDLSTDYFAPPAQLNAFTHTWSLGVEEQFYVIFPVLLWATGFTAARPGGRRRLFRLVALVSLLSLLAFLVLSVRQPIDAFYLMPARFWELGSGCLLYLGMSSPPGSSPDPQAAGCLPLFPLPAPVMVGLLLATLVGLPTSAMAVGAPLMVVLTTLLIAAVLREPEGKVSGLLRHPHAVGIGLLSYSLYLWHWPVLYVSRFTVGVQWWTLPIQIGLMIALAMTSYRWVEAPLRRGLFPAGRWRAISAGVLTVLVGAWVLVWTDRHAQAQIFLGNHNSHARREPWSNLAIPDTRITPQACELNNTDQQGPTSPEGFARLLETCTAPPERTPSTTGSPAPPHVFLIGDSHAMAFSPVLAHVRQAGNAEVTLLAHTGCLFPNTPYGHSQSICSRFLDLAESQLLEFIRPGDVVVITGYLLSHLGDSSQLRDTRNDILGSDGRPVLSGERKLELYRQGLDRFAMKAAARGGAVVLVGATPRNPDIRNCVPDWFNVQPKQDCERTVTRELDHAIALNRRLRQVLPAQVQLYDPIPALCGKGCDNEAVLELLRDTDHLSSAGARRLGASFLAFLRQVRLPPSS
ncbi:acyltransferase family protein [Synechococcus sp. BA-124 BA4]|uniref:acyltransferase family protein n=1 Tax=unclassified Synechococcus TaxID=2626047 RepID=UPI0018CF8A10|nr:MULTISPECIES: acyltransferase family protein [unclassified Synechococcus]MEA5399520.1 acyltransferase family protein [Synechococcus sp. BA-124 BA4]QPN55975.1 acyltransferase [Synechococcus sp. CBW1107]CAK6700092.1 hypothetical protein BBFGKLBO_02791 [Synechococcus sp. CBW1107]